MSASTDGQTWRAFSAKQKQLLHIGGLFPISGSRNPAPELVVGNYTSAN